MSEVRLDSRAQAITTGIREHLPRQEVLEEGLLGTRVGRAHANFDEYEASRRKYKVSSYKYRSGAQKGNMSWQCKFGYPWLLTEPTGIDRY